MGTGADRGGALILGAVIAGGAATRFGDDKALAELGGRPLIAHAIAVIEPFCHTVVVVGRAWGGLPSLADVPAAGLGPLGGVAAALAHAAAVDDSAVLTIACDMPRVPHELLEALIERPPAYCGDAPILGCWPVTLAGALRQRLEASVEPRDRSIRGWARDMGALPIAAPGLLANVNTPADLLAL